MNNPLNTAIQQYSGKLARITGAGHDRWTAGHGFGSRPSGNQFAQFIDSESVRANLGTEIRVYSTFDVGLRQV
jgi:hypothetical protein